MSLNTDQRSDAGVRLKQTSAEILYRYLLITRPHDPVTHDGNRTVHCGPIRVRYLARTVEITFPDPFADITPAGPVVVLVPDKQAARTFGAVAAVVAGLLDGPGVIA